MALANCPALSWPERPPGFAQVFLPLEPALGQIRVGRDGEPLAPLQYDHHGPHRDGLGAAPGQGAQVPAAVQVVEHPGPGAGPQRGLEPFQQVRGGVLETTRDQVENGVYGWAAFFLVLGALNLAGGYWYITIARSA
jgi:hypothetical protein